MTRRYVFSNPKVIHKEEGTVKGIPNMGNLMKQAQQFQAKISKLQEELGDRTVEASAGGGMITVVANGRQEVVSVKIDPEVIDPADAGMLEDLIQAAVNDALTRAKNMVNEEMGKLTKGLNMPNIPGLMG
jgi:DNA-binding YbaB/EbfC family protein